MYLQRSMRLKYLGAEGRILPVRTWIIMLTLILKTERLQQLNINLNGDRLIDQRDRDNKSALILATRNEYLPSPLANPNALGPDLQLRWKSKGSRAPPRSQQNLTGPIPESATRDGAPVIDSIRITPQITNDLFRLLKLIRIRTYPRKMDVF
jgi:hypothetical protein